MNTEPSERPPADQPAVERVSENPPEGSDLDRAQPPSTSLDLTKPRRGETPSITEVSPYSEAWAKILWPITRSLLALIAAVMFTPFVLIALVSDAATLDKTLDWAKTILPPVVGFGGAIMGYYFGTRSGPSGNDTQEPGEE